MFMTQAGVQQVFPSQQQEQQLQQLEPAALQLQQQQQQQQQDGGVATPSGVPAPLGVELRGVLHDIKDSPDPRSAWKALKFKKVLHCSNAADADSKGGWRPADEAAALAALSRTSSSGRRSTSSNSNSGRPAPWQHAAAKLLSVTGDFVSVRVGCAYTITGQWAHDDTYGWSVKALGYEEVLQDSDPLTFLQGLRGIGPQSARDLLGHFGGNLGRVLEALSLETEAAIRRLSQVPGIGRASARELKDSWDTLQASQHQLRQLEQQLDLPPSLAKRLAEKHQQEVLSILRADPYAPLLLHRLPGYGLNEAEKVAAAVGFDPAAPQRAAAYLLTTLQAAATTDSLLAVPWGELQDRAAAELASRIRRLGVPAWPLPAGQGLREGAELLQQEGAIVCEELRWHSDGDSSVSSSSSSRGSNSGGSGSGSVPEVVLVSGAGWSDDALVMLRELHRAEEGYVEWMLRAAAACWNALTRLQPGLLGGHQDAATASASATSSTTSSSSSRTRRRRASSSVTSRGRSSTSTASSGGGGGGTTTGGGSVRLPLPPPCADGDLVTSMEHALSADMGLCVELNEGQRAVLGYALQALPVLVVTGGPGCGKTLASQAVARAVLLEGEQDAAHDAELARWRREHGSFGDDDDDDDDEEEDEEDEEDEEEDDRLLYMAAPTGRAAQRLQELVRGDPRFCQASTIHRLLRFRGHPPHSKSASGSNGEPPAGGSNGSNGGSNGSGADEAASDAIASLDLMSQCTYGSSNPLKQGAYLLDEVSMLDMPLAAALFNAWSWDTSDSRRLLLVGDTDQLPPVGPGRPIAAALAEGLLPCIDLRCIYRSAADSGIVKSAHAINRGEPPSLTVWDIAPGRVGADISAHIAAARGGGPPAATDGSGLQLLLPSNALFLRLPDDVHEGEVAQALEEAARLLLPQLTADMQLDVQVLSPIKASAIGTEALNARLQPLFNPAAAGRAQMPMFSSNSSSSRVWRVGDRVVQLKNDSELDVYNGELGYIDAVDPARGQLTVRYPPRSSSGGGSRWRGGRRGGRRGGSSSAHADVDAWSDDRGAFHLVTYQGAAAIREQLQLAWATTVHKAQGGEYPICLLPLHSAVGRWLLRRQVLYTAVSRAKQALIIVGTQRALDSAIANTSSPAAVDLERLRAKLRSARVRRGLPTFQRAVFGPDGWQHVERE